jgi:hypothetical protein
MDVVEAVGPVPTGTCKATFSIVGGSVFWGWVYCGMEGVVFVRSSGLPR